MDWMFTDTALGLSSWLQLEDIYSNVYLLKCARWAEKVIEEYEKFYLLIYLFRNIQPNVVYLDRKQQNMVLVVHCWLY
jgi:hypothetical protein